MTLKEKMIRTAKACDFINTDGEWSACRNLKEFEEFVKRQGFEIEWSLSSDTCKALVQTVDGYQFTYNGYCNDAFKYFSKEQYLNY